MATRRDDRNRIGGYSRQKLNSITRRGAVGNISAVAAGTGISGGGQRGTVTLNLDVSELSALGATAASGDYIVIQDVTDNSTKKVLVSNLGIGSSTSFVFEDDSGDEVTISNGKEIKFIGSGITTNWTDTSDGSDSDPYDLTFTVDAAQTGITSLLATGIKIGEDDQTKIDFETADEIHFYAANAEQVYISDGVFGPQSDSDVDLGTTGVRWKDAYVDSVTTTGNILCSGEVQAANIGYTDGDNAMTIADGGKVTFAAGFSVGSDAAGDVLYHNGTSYVRLAKGSDDEVLTLASGVPSWAASGAGAVSAAANGADNRVATFSSSTALNGEANLTFDGNTLIALAGAMVNMVANKAAIAATTILKTGYNSLMLGPITLNDGVALTVQNGANLKIINISEL